MSATNAAPKKSVKKSTAAKSAAAAAAPKKAPAKKAPEKAASVKTPAKKSSTKKVPAKAPKTVSEGGPGNPKQGFSGSTGKWNAHKESLLKAMKSLKATSVPSGASAVQLAERTGLKAEMVRHYSYQLAADGIVAVGRVEGNAGYAFSLTAKGMKVDPSKGV